MSRNRSLLLLSIFVVAFGAGCPGSTPEPEPEPVTQPEVAEFKQLQTLGRHAEAEAFALEFGISIEEEFVPIESFRETLDAGDDPLTPGCVCCYSDAQCRIIEGRSVDECFPGGDGGDDLSENIAKTECTQGSACAKRKQYSCDKVLPGSVCRLRDVTCCGVETTSGYCYLDIT